MGFLERLGLNFSRLNAPKNVRISKAECFMFFVSRSMVVAGSKMPRIQVRPADHRPITVKRLEGFIY
jgi:hypothetical protein